LKRSLTRGIAKEPELEKDRKQPNIKGPVNHERNDGRGS
jgi:hypothetical protein